jgi:hypothetical protein
MIYDSQSWEDNETRRMEQLFGTVYNTPLHPPLAVVSQIFKRGWAAKERFGLPEAPVLDVSITPRRTESLPLAAFATIDFIDGERPWQRKPEQPALPAPPEQRVRGALAEHWQRLRLTREYSSRLDFLSYRTDAQALYERTETKEFSQQEKTWLSDLRSPGPAPKTALPGNIYRVKELQKNGAELRFSFLPLFAWVRKCGPDWAEAFPLILLNHPGPHEATRRAWEKEVSRAQREDGAIVLAISPAGKTARVAKWTAATPLRLFQRDQSLNYVAMPRFACRFRYDQLRPRPEGHLRVPPARAYAAGWQGGLLRQQMAAALETSASIFDGRSEDAGFWVNPEEVAQTPTRGPRA